MKKPLLILCCVAAALGLPFVFYPIYLMEALCYAIFASALNLLFGYAGLLSFGHAAFFGTAAYVAGYCVKILHFGPLAGIACGALSAALLSLVIGSLSIRRQGIYFAMITFAFGEMVYFAALQAPFTGGEDGLQSIPRGHLFGLIDLSNDRAMYYFVLAIAVATGLAIYRIINSPFGNILVAIRENEQRAISLGYSVGRYKLLAFVMSATLSGVAGATKALVFHFSSLNNIHWHQSGEVVLMTLLGGVGTFFGPALGAVFVVSLEHFLAEMGEWVTFIIGATFVVCVLTFRRGVVGELVAYRTRANKQRVLPRPAEGWQANGLKGTLS